MMIIKVRKQHRCIVCCKSIWPGEKVLRAYVDRGRHYYCKYHAKLELQKLLKQL